MISLLFALALAQADTNSVDLKPDLRQHGKLFVVTLVPGEKNLRLYVAGHQTGGFSFGKTGVKAYFKNGKDVTPVDVERETDHFVIKQAESKPRELRLEISDQHGTEEFQLRTK